MAGMGGMAMGGALKGSQNMEGPCYKDPTAVACKDFTRSDAGARAVGTGGTAEAAGDACKLAAGTSLPLLPLLRTPTAHPTACASLPPAADWEEDLALLCDAMPYMPACSLWTQCQVGGRGLGPCLPRGHARLPWTPPAGPLAPPPTPSLARLPATQSCFAAGKYCELSALVGTVCAADMPRVRGRH